jgi:hypothetical protein
MFPLLGCYAALIGTYGRFGTAYRYHLTLEGRTDRLSLNVGNYHCWVTSQNVEVLIYTAAQVGNYRTVISYIGPWINIEYDILHKHDGIRSMD